jgi:putative tryptophan/tyrosine transport system substrate-binding protein
MAIHIRRREFVFTLGGAAAAWPLAARAQRSTVPVVGLLSTSSPEASPVVAAIRDGLEEAGYVEGKNVAIEYRWRDTQSIEELRELAADLVRRRVAVIVAYGAANTAFAAKAATSTIPIVILGGADPVRYGLVDSLSRPGGNVTGVTFIVEELAGKRLDLMRELMPQARTIGYLIGDQINRPNQELTSNLIAAGRALGQEVIALECRSVEDFDTAFATLVERRASALIVSAFPKAYNNRAKVLALAAQHKIPAIYPQSPYAREGGLMAYSAVVNFRRIAVDYVAAILKGAKPADLPVQQPTKYELIINLKTAKALGLEIPPKLLALADEVIE